MSLEEQNERIRRNQSSSMRDKRRSLNLSAGPLPPNFKVVRMCTSLLTQTTLKSKILG